jgi:nickel transport protein
MTETPRFRAVLTALLALILAAPLTAGQAQAHGVVWRQGPSDRTVSLSFIYSDQTPMMYSKVRLFSPADPEVPYQSGATDKNGGFAFTPDVPGIWKFEANDGQGHLASGELEAVLPLAAPPGAPASDGAQARESPALASGGAQGPSWERMALGLSLIVNIAMIAGRLRRQKSGGRPSSGPGKPESRPGI